MKQQDNSRLVIVTWIDARQPTASWTWISEYKPETPVECVTVGWLIQDDEHVKSIAQSKGDAAHDGDVQIGGVMKIPTRCVVSIETLVEKTKLREAAE